MYHSIYLLSMNNKIQLQILFGLRLIKQAWCWGQTLVTVRKFHILVDTASFHAINLDLSHSIKPTLAESNPHIYRSCLFILFAGAGGNHLWEFIRDLLFDSRYNPALIKWEDREEGVFKFVKSDQVAKLWGKKKNNSAMTYEKLSRAMRWELYLCKMDSEIIFYSSHSHYFWKGQNNCGMTWHETKQDYCGYGRHTLQI